MIHDIRVYIYIYRSIAKLRWQQHYIYANDWWKLWVIHWFMGHVNRMTNMFRCNPSYHNIWITFSHSFTIVYHFEFFNLPKCSCYWWLCVKYVYMSVCMKNDTINIFLLRFLAPRLVGIDYFFIFILLKEPKDKIQKYTILFEITNMKCRPSPAACDDGTMIYNSSYYTLWFQVCYDTAYHVIPSSTKWVDEISQFSIRNTNSHK